MIRANTELRPSLVAGIGMLGTPVILMLLAGLVQRAPLRAIVVVLALAPAPVLFITSGEAIDLMVSAVLLVPPSWLGRTLVARWLPDLPSPEAWVIGSAAGLGACGALMACLGLLGWIGVYATWLVTLGVAVAMAAFGRGTLRRDLASFRVWLARRDAWDWISRVQAGIAIAGCWMTLWWATIPELWVDAVTVRLPSAAYVVASGRLATNPDLLNPLEPHVSELIYAYVLTVGSLGATKVVSLFAGWLSVASAGLIASQLGGRQAVLPTLVSVASLPILLTSLQGASADAFSVLFAVVTGLVLVRERAPGWRTLLAGALGVTLGLGVKAAFASSAVGFLLAAPTLLPRVSVRWRILATFAVGASLLIVTANLALVQRALALLGVGEPLWLATVAGLMSSPAVGAQRSPISLLWLPVELTFQTSLVSGEPAGTPGYLILALLPLAFLRVPGLRFARLLSIALGGGLFWAWTVLYPRYGLPIAVLLCIAGGVALARTNHAALRESQRRITNSAVVLLGMIGLLAYLASVLAWPGLPWRVALGLESRAAFLERIFPEYPVLQRLDAEPSARRAAITMENVPRIYARTPLNPVLAPRTWGAADTLQHEDLLLSYLEREGYTHIVSNHSASGTWWIGNLGADESFLRRNTDLVAGNRGVYLYRLVPASQRGSGRPWAAGRELVPNPGFEEGEGGTPSGWRGSGPQATYDATGRESHQGRGAVRVSQSGEYVSEVPVRAGTEYLLSACSRAVSGSGWIMLDLIWKDSSGRVLARSNEIAPIDDTGYRQWSMLATAPPASQTALITLRALDGAIWFDDVSLRSRDDGDR